MSRGEGCEEKLVLATLSMAILTYVFIWSGKLAAVNSKKTFDLDVL